MSGGTGHLDFFGERGTDWTVVVVGLKKNVSRAVDVGDCEKEEWLAG
jgi:hypothetical protein